MKLDCGLIWAPRAPEPWRRPLPDMYRDILDEVRLAEHADFESVWFSEHHFVDDDYLPDVFPMLGAAAAITERVRIGSYVLLAPLHHPMRLAEQAAVTDNLSNGRLELGMGIGYRQEEFDGYQVPHAARGAIFDELLDVLLQAWTSEQVEHVGEHFQISGARVRPKPVQQPIKVLIGGMSKAALRRAMDFPSASVAGRPTAANMEWLVSRAAKAGKDVGEIDFVPFRYVWVAKTTEEAKRIAEPYARYVIELYDKWAVANNLTPHPAPPEEQIIAGSPEQVIDALCQYVERRPDVPVSRIVLQAPLLGLDHEESMKMIELTAAEVLPKLR